MKRVRIRVMKMACYGDLIEQFENPIEHPCDMHLGDTFYVENGEKPEGMCDSAWETLRPFVQELAAGGGNFFDGTTYGKYGKTLNYRESIALETQKYPDTPHHAHFPSTLLNPGEKYTHVCVYKFGIK